MEIHNFKTHLDMFPIHFTFLCTLKGKKIRRYRIVSYFTNRKTNPNFIFKSRSSGKTSIRKEGRSKRDMSSHAGFLGDGHHPKPHFQNILFNLFLCTTALTGSYKENQAGKVKLSSSCKMSIARNSSKYSIIQPGVSTFL